MGRAKTFILLSFFSGLLACYGWAAQEEKKLYAVVSADSATVVSTAPTESGFMVPIKRKVVELSQGTFDQLNDFLVTLDQQAAKYDTNSKVLEIDQIEVAYTVTAEGNIAIVAGSAEGSLKYTLRRKKSKD